MGIGITEAIPSPDPADEQGRISYDKALKYMGFHEGERLLDKPVDYVFLGSCTNGRIEDFRAFAEFVKGKRRLRALRRGSYPARGG